VFANVSNLHPSLILGGKAESQPLELSPIISSTLVATYLAYKYLTVVKVTDSDKHTSLLG